MIIARRSFLTGIIAACAAPAIVRSGIIMPVNAKLVGALTSVVNITIPRNIVITATNSTNVTITIHGHDFYGNPVSEIGTLLPGAAYQCMNVFANSPEISVHNSSMDQAKVMIGLGDRSLNDWTIPTKQIWVRRDHSLDSFLS